MKLAVTTATFGPMAPHLMDLAGALTAASQPLILIGGFGLLLRRAYRVQEQTQTLLEALPASRTTDDFDVVLSLELLANPAARQAISSVLTTLGYKVEVQYFQFVKPGTHEPNGKKVKVDFLTPLPGPDAGAVKVKAMRVGAAKRAPGEPPLHAYATPELIALDAPGLTFDIEGPGTDGHHRTGRVTLPHPFTLMLMKLHAFADEHRGKRDLGPRPAYARKHALDVLTLAALLTPEESDQLPDIQLAYSSYPPVQEAAAIIDEYFSSSVTSGVAYLQPPLQPRSEDESKFLELLQDTYGRPREE
ncbi:hypothetical protein [Deinococcus yunweiensis]|uniref:hypothetical protein n=1 Tax=Deinococcus yunweiensis TaxID=367282 RepID=UPI00398F844D